MCKFRLDLPNIKQTFYLQRHHMLLEFLTRFLQKSWEEGLCYCLRWVFLLAYCYSMICLSDTVFKPSQATGTCSRYVVTVRVLASGANCGLTMLLVLLLFRGVFFRSPGHPPPLSLTPSSSTPPQNQRFQIPSWPDSRGWKNWYLSFVFL